MSAQRSTPSLLQAIPQVFAHPLPPILQVPHSIFFVGHASHLAIPSPHQLRPADDDPARPAPKAWDPRRDCTLTQFIAIVFSLELTDIPAQNLVYLFYAWAVPDIQLILSVDPLLPSHSWQDFCGILRNAFPDRLVVNRSATSAAVTLLREQLRDRNIVDDTYGLIMHHFYQLFTLFGDHTPHQFEPSGPPSPHPMHRSSLIVFREGFKHIQAMQDNNQYMTYCTEDLVNNVLPLVMAQRSKSHPDQYDFVLDILANTRRSVTALSDLIQDLRQLFHNAYNPDHDYPFQIEAPPSPSTPLITLRYVSPATQA